MLVRNPSLPSTGNPVDGASSGEDVNVVKLVTEFHALKFLPVDAVGRGTVSFSRCIYIEIYIYIYSTLTSTLPSTCTSTSTSTSTSTHTDVVKLATECEESSVDAFGIVDGSAQLD